MLNFQYVSTLGYQRLHWDEEFSLGAIGFSTTSYHYNSWYECGVSIPEASQPGKEYDFVSECNTQINTVYNHKALVIEES